MTSYKWEIKWNIKDVEELKQGLQKYQNTNDNKLVEVDNSIKQQKSRTHSTGRTHTTRNTMTWKKNDRSRQDNLRIDGIPEYEKEPWDDTEELLKDALHKKLGVSKI